MDDAPDLARGSDNPFRDVGTPDADAELMKADLAAGVVRILRESDLSPAEAARLAEVAVADISRVRRAALDRFTIDRLVRIHNRLDRGTRIRVDFSGPRDAGKTAAVQPWALTDIGISMGPYRHRDLMWYFGSPKRESA